MPKSVQYLNSLFNDKAFQIALVGAILFLLIAHPILINLVDRLFSVVGIELNETLLIILHSIVYAIALYYSVLVILKIEA